jgi:hypothetical protein
VGGLTSPPGPLSPWLNTRGFPPKAALVVGYRYQDSGLRFKDLGFRIQDLGFRF